MMEKEAPMDVRDMQGDPAIWEKLSWENMSSKEQELWTLLGWSREMWNRNQAPASANKVWHDLTSQEQAAAMELGFTQDLWDNFEDQ
jgi:hypothetical protein